MKKFLTIIGLICLGLSSVLAQTVQITGTVTGAEDGQPLPGVSVVVKGTIQGTVTDNNGKYSLSIPDKAVLVFSFVGMNTREIQTGSNTIIDVVMEPSSLEIDEVVVVAYGTQSVKRVTTAISGVKSTDIKDLPVPNVAQALQGKMSGVHISSTSGRPGAPVMMAIRGRSSITAGNDPLYVIDGVPIANKDDRLDTNQGEGYSVLANMNMDDIESIDVLKDAAAAAMYGSRGSNGVVLITTKKGKYAGSKDISFSAYYGFQSLVKSLDLLNASEYRTMYNEAVVNSGGTAPFSQDQINNPTADVNWLKEIQRDNSAIQSYQLSSSGGGNNMSYYASLGYFNQDGLLQKGGFDRYSGRLNLESRYSDMLKFGMNMGLSRTNREETTYDNSIFSPWPKALSARPDEPIYDTDGSFYDGSYNNPVKMFLPESALRISNVLSNIYGEIQILPGLSFKSSLGIDYTITEQNIFNPTDSYTGQSSNGEGYSATARRTNWLATQTLAYKKNFFDNKLYFDAVAVYEYQSDEVDRLWAQGQNFPSNQTKYITSAASITGASSSWTGNNLESYLARVNLAWDSKYLLGLSIRRDGSSKFPKSDRYGTFPSVSAGWNIDQEDFMLKADFISTLKIRGSYGETGNQAGIGDFAYMRTFTSSGTYSPIYNKQPGFVLSRLGSPNLTWESTAQFDIGIDLGLWNDRVKLALDVYQKNTKNLLVNKPIPSTTGFISQLENVGDLKGKGLDITINSVNFEGKFNWNTTFTMSFYNNEVTKLYNNQPINGAYVTRIAVGQPLGSYFVIKALGVDPQTGDMIYEDISGADKKPDGRITDDDRQFLGSPLPKVQGGFTNTFSYMGFDLNIFFQYSFGNKWYKLYEEGAGGAASMGAAEIPTNVLRHIYEDRWTTVGQNTEQPRPLYKSTLNVQRSSRFLENAGYVRLKNITLGYTLPSNILEKIRIKDLRIYVTGQNLLTFTKYTGFDPEITTELDVLNYGVDQGAIPQMKSVLFGINLKF